MITVVFRMDPRTSGGGIKCIADTLKYKIMKKKKVSLTDYDPVYKVIYLGNVLTPWAKGDGCVDKPLSTLWNNYRSNVKHEILMKITICASGIKAITREHGLTEYWANRITFCYAHPSYPKVFCWIYRHEAKKLKQELRCHAVLCLKESDAIEMSEILRNNLTTALQEFRREKRMRQNFRMIQSHSQKHSHLKSLDHYSLDSQSTSCDDPANDDESCSSSEKQRDTCDCSTQIKQQTNGNAVSQRISARKMHLVRGQANFKPPLERSKSAPRLTSIDEESDCDELTHLLKFLQPSSCLKDPHSEDNTAIYLVFGDREVQI